MIQSDKYWKRIDILELAKECSNDIANNIPPPRPIERGSLKIKHFIYHIEDLKIKLMNSQESKAESGITTLKRKLNGRDLQIKQLRKRIELLTNELMTKESRFKSIQDDNIKLESANKVLREEIISLNNKINIYKQDNGRRDGCEESMSVDESDEELSVDADTMEEESISQTIEANTQDNEFIVDDYNDNDEEKYEPSEDETSDDNSDSSSDYSE